MATDRTTVPSDVAEVLTSLTRLLVDTYDEQTLLQRVLDVAVRAVEGCDDASLSLQKDGEVWTAVATSDAVLAVDESQYTAGVGPSLTAYSEQRVVKVEVGLHHDRWPLFCSVAGVAGVASFLSAPLCATAEPFGTLNLCSGTAAAFDEVDEKFLALLTAHAAYVIDTGLRHARARALAAQLSEAMVSRAVIEQAKGLLIALHGFDADDAFAALRRESQRTNTKLRDVASSLVSRAQQQKVTRGPAAPAERGGSSPVRQVAR